MGIWILVDLWVALIPSPRPRDVMVPLGADPLCLLVNDVLAYVAYAACEVSGCPPADLCRALSSFPVIFQLVTSGEES